MTVSATTRWRIVVSALLTVALAAVAMFAHRELAKRKKPPERVEQEAARPAVKCVRVTRGPYREVLVGYGRARALRETEVAAEVGGTIVWIAPGLEAGRTVAAGDELVRIDPRDHEQEVARTAAELAQARAVTARHEQEGGALSDQLDVAREELEVARGELRRAEELIGGDTLSRQERDERRRLVSTIERMVLELEWRQKEVAATLAADRAAEDRAAAALAKARLDLERSVVRAPYAARVRRRDAELGARVAPGTILVSLIDVSVVEVPVELPASRFGDVTAGAAARLRLREDGPVRWSGRVARVAAEVDAESRTFEAYVEVENPAQDPVVPPGAFVIAAVEGALHEDVIAVPRVAFVGDLVYVAEREGAESREARAVRRHPVVRRLLPDHALVEEGLSAGDEVIVTNLEQIADESMVHVTASDRLTFRRDALDVGEDAGGTTEETPGGSR